MPQAVLYNSFGAPDVLEVVDVPEVHPEAGKVRIAVRAVGLNPFDFKMRWGRIPLKTVVFPRGVCLDFAGVVDEVAEGATYADGSFVAIGDEVFGWADGGTAREQLLALAANLTRKPGKVSWEVAGSFTTIVQTAHFSLEALEIGAADTVLVSAAAGSVGFVYSQLAIARGARVIGTSSEANFSRLEAIGVTPTSYGPGLAARVRALAPDGVTAVQDNFGRETIDAGFELGLGADRICSIVDHDAVAELGLASPGRYVKTSAINEQYVAMIADGSLSIPVQAVYPLSGIREAFELLEERHVSGKIVVRP
jgi:NADPH:quinone reductase-like Zn-dependent oxidoreductase